MNVMMMVMVVRMLLLLLLLVKLCLCLCLVVCWKFLLLVRSRKKLLQMIDIDRYAVRI